MSLAFIVRGKADEFYRLPQVMMIFCSCKSNCSNRCKCKKSDSILRTCSRLLCKTCKCFTKDKEGEDEDIILSQRYQGFLDGLSSDESEEEESDLDTSIESVTYFEQEDENELDESF